MKRKEILTSRDQLHILVYAMIIVKANNVTVLLPEIKCASNSHVVRLVFKWKMLWCLQIEVNFVHAKILNVWNHIANASKTMESALLCVDVKTVEIK